MFGWNAMDSSEKLCFKADCKHAQIPCSLTEPVPDEFFEAGLDAGPRKHPIRISSLLGFLECFFKMYEVNSESSFGLSQLHPNCNDNNLN